MSEQTVRILSLIVGAILATLGWVRNDYAFLLPAIIISPLGAILNDIASNTVNAQITNLLYNLGMLGIMCVVSIIISFRLGKMVKVDTETLKKIDKFNEAKWLHFGVSIVIGIFTAVLMNTPSTLNQILCIIVGAVVTILTPLVNIGITLSSQSDKKGGSTVTNDLKICLTNMLGFAIGATSVHLYLKKK